jgi:antitoxin component YwqK of YwqJK toxin-antitoxin module
MKQLICLSLFVTGVYASTAQNISTASQLAATLTEIKKAPADFPGEKHKGTWVSYYANGNRCDSGYLINNIPHGVWKSWYPNGQLRIQMSCNAKRLASAKDEMDRIYKPGFAPGPNLREMRQLVANAPYPYDKLVYRQLYLSIHPPTLDDNDEQVKVSVQNGDKINSFQTGAPPFTECMVHGVYQSWFEDGMLMDSGYCDKGIREGVWQEWDENMDMKAVGFYKNGLRWKDWRYYNKEGKLQYIRWYNRQEEVTETIVLK